MTSVKSYQLQLELNWTKDLDTLHCALTKLPHIMVLTVSNISLTHVKFELLPNISKLNLFHCIIDMDVFNLMKEQTKLMDVGMRDCIVHVSHEIMVQNFVFTGNYSLEVSKNKHKTKRLKVSTCSYLPFLNKDIQDCHQLLIKNAQILDLMDLPLLHLHELVILNSSGTIELLSKLISKLPDKFYIEFNDFSIHSQCPKFAMIDLELQTSRTLNLANKIIRISNKNNSTLDIGSMIPHLLLV